MIEKFGFRKARSLLPKRSASQNKTHGGKTLIVAGSRGMFGAAVLSATAAARMGSGYVTLLTDKAFPSHRHPDFLIATSAGLADWKFSALAIGPGLGTSPRSARLLAQALKLAPPRVVLDADALNLSAQRKLSPFPTSWILTPHEGELARLLGVSSRTIHERRAYYARLAQKKLGCIVLLKGHRTLVATPDRVIEVESGNAALAKAGTGDVLTGMIAGLLAQGLAPTDAACLAAFLHGHLADQWIRKRDPLTLMASGLLDLLPTELRRLRVGRRKPIGR